MSEVARRDPSWRLGVIAGAASLVLGVLLVVWPRKSLAVLAWLGGIAVFVWGVRQATGALRHPNRFERTGGLFVALVSVGFGLAVVVVPEISLRLLRILLGVAAIVWGLMDSARPPPPGRSRWWGFVVRGLGSLGLGLALILVPEPTVSLIAILLGILLILWGLIEVVAAFVLRPAPARSP
jgi:uncharacterized membrane protein HdeD (DUF308 family)